MDKKATLLEILEEVKPDVDFEKETAIIDDGILDSMDVVDLVVSISDEFGVDIPAGEILEENFNSVDAMLALIEKLD